MEISYVIPTLNSASTLDMTILSLKNQKNVKLNILVVDSGSTDGTLDICKRWGIETIYAEPGNMYSAINIGLSKCNTEWLAYINSDDWLYQDSVYRLIEHGKTVGADIVYGNCDYVDSVGSFLFSMAAAKSVDLFSLFKTSLLGFAQPSAIFHQTVFKKLNCFDENYKFSSDADFYLRAIKEDFKFALLSGSPVACFRLHEKQLSQTKFREMEKEKTLIYSNQAGTPRIIDWLVYLRWKAKNTPHYLIRLIRKSLISGKIKITNSLNN